jgi:membrane-associated HD superfamily phosphohydrolase
LLNLAKTYSPKSDTPSANPFGLTDEPAKDPALKPAQKSPVAVKDPLSIEKEWITKRNGFTDEKDLKKFLKDNPDLSQKMKRATEELLQARTDATKNFQAGFETPL